MKINKLNPTQKYKLFHAMEQSGTAFAKHLSMAWFFAAPSDALKIEVCFEDYIMSHAVYTDLKCRS